jgi:hypothetical protein
MGSSVMESVRDRNRSSSAEEGYTTLGKVVEEKGQDAERFLGFDFLPIEIGEVRARFALHERESGRYV